MSSDHPSSSGAFSSPGSDDEDQDVPLAESKALDETSSDIVFDENAATATRVASGKSSHDQHPRPGFLSGHLIAGRYEVREALGQGGFGAVFQAHDRQLNRVVAIKQSTGLRSFVAGRIRNEAQSVASLNHPNIVAIYDLIGISDHELLIVMECLEGMTLSRRLRHSRLSVRDAVKTLLLAEARRPGCFGGQHTASFLGGDWWG